MKKKAVKTTACVIVKNEAENLPQWLACMQTLADEMVVVDTGSTDNTTALAEAAGARVFSFPWINDFAAAKNYALEQCRGNWVLMLDADEYIAAEDYDGVQKSIEKYDWDKNVIGFVCKLVNVDKDKNNAYISTIYQIRVFRTLPSLRYIGAVHEMLQYSGPGKKRMLFVDDFTIYHTGYSHRIMPEKYRRNLQMLKASIEKYGKRTLDDLYLADCYYGLRQYESAARHARAYVENPDRAQGEENRAYGILIQSLLFLNQPFAEIYGWVKKALHEFPYAAEFKIMEGYAREDNEDYDGAEKCYREAVRIYEYAKNHDAGRNVLQSDEAGSALPDVYARLERLAQRKKCCEELVKYLRQIENGADVQKNIEGLWQLCGEKGITFEYLQEVMQQNLTEYKRTLQVLAASLQGENKLAETKKIP